MKGAPCRISRNNLIVNFAEYLPPVAKSKFFVKAPDIITIRIWTPLTMEKNLEKSIILPITFRLSDISKGREKAKGFIGE